MWGKTPTSLWGNSPQGLRGFPRLDVVGFRPGTVTGAPGTPLSEKRKHAGSLSDMSPRCRRFCSPGTRGVWPWGH